MKKFLLYGFPLKDEYCSGVILFLRIFVGILMLTHGLYKFVDFSTLVHTFPNPLGLGSATSLVLSIIAEVGCSMLLFIGLFTRLATIPLIINMLTIIIMVDSGMAFHSRELAIMYLAIYGILFFTGGAKYSLDTILFWYKTK